MILLQSYRLMLLEDNQIAFHSEDDVNFDSVRDYSRQIAEMIGLGSDSDFSQAGVRLLIFILSLQFTWVMFLSCDWRMW